MKFSISAEIAAKYPNTAVAAVFGTCAKNAFAAPELEQEFKNEKNAIEQCTRTAFAEKPLAENPHIGAWRKMFRSFGEDPTKKRSSAEALARRIVKGEALPEISALVDVYNFASVKFLLPMGGYDLSKISGDIRIRFAKEGEPFSPIGSGEPESTNQGEAIYSDEARVLTRKWNYRDCADCQIDENTTRFVLFVEGAEEIPKNEVENAAAFLAQSLSKYAGCECKTAVCWARQPQASLD